MDALSSNHICDGAILYPSPIIQIFIKTMTGKTITLTVAKTYTIDEIQKMILAKEGVAESEQRLIYAGVHLEAEKTLPYYQIRQESTLHMVLRLRGGRASSVSC